ncbi:hypothetical protein ACO0K8_08765 [Undibacterium sp. Ren11W]
MLSESETRQLLIDSYHSSPEADRRISEALASQEFVALLLHIAVDADDYQGDAPMTAAYFLSQASVVLLQPHEEKLLALLETADGYAGSVALALGRIQSPSAKATIEQRLAEGWWSEHLYKEALSCYGNA